MMIGSTMILAVTMVIAGIALWDQINGPDWFTDFMLGFGILAVIGSFVMYLWPRHWKLTSFILGVPGVVTLAIGVLATWDISVSPNAQNLGHGGISWGLAIGSVCLIWATFFVVALARDHRSHHFSAHPSG
jgi:hypothetical protein